MGSFNVVVIIENLLRKKKITESQKKEEERREEKEKRKKRGKRWSKISKNKIIINKVPLLWKDLKGFFFKSRLNKT